MIVTFIFGNDSYIYIWEWQLRYYLRIMVTFFLLGERRFTLFTSGMGALNYKSQVVTISLDG